MPLYRKKTGELVGAGERVPNPHGEGDLILSKWRLIPVFKGRKKRAIRYDVAVDAYERVDDVRFIGYDTFEPYQLGLIWRDQ